MAITYTWEVTGLRTSTIANTSDVVIQTYWKKTGTDENGNTGEFIGATPFEANSMPANTVFIPFSNLTENNVLEWIKAVVVDGYEEHVNERIQYSINQKITPIVDAPLPWAPANTVINSNVAVSNT